MTPSRNQIRLLPRLLLLMFLPIIASGCSSDEDCDSPSTTLIYISEVEGQDPSFDYDNEKKRVDNALVLIYDEDGQLQRTVKLTREEIENKTPIKIDINGSRYPQVVVWGNLNGSEDLSAIKPGQQIASTRLSMQQEEGFALSTDILYYGYKKLTSESLQKIEIATWVGSVYITVCGIDEKQIFNSSYYFIIESDYNSYDFYGNPQQGKAVLKVDARTEYYQREPILVNPSVNLIGYPTNSYESQSMTVKLYKRESEGDVLIASADKDSGGNSIMAHAGDNTNILLDFIDNKLNVYYKLTPWENIYQWAWW